MHTDLAECDAYEVAEQAENNQLALAEVLDQITETARAITLSREDIKGWEADLARYVKEAFEHGATGPQLARATGLSRERIYQIRDGRR